VHDYTQAVHDYALAAAAAVEHRRVETAAGGYATSDHSVLKEGQHWQPGLQEYYWFVVVRMIHRE